MESAPDLPVVPAPRRLAPLAAASPFDAVAAAVLGALRESGRSEAVGLLGTPLCDVAGLAALRLAPGAPLPPGSERAPAA